MANRYWDGLDTVGDIISKNRFNWYPVNTYNATYEENDTGYKVASTGRWSQLNTIFFVKPNTKYYVSFDIEISSSVEWGIGIFKTDNSTKVKSIGGNSNGHYSFTFESGTNTELQLRLCPNNTANANNGIYAIFTNVQIEEFSETSYSYPKSIGYRSGKNSRGTWIKYDDGTLIQFGENTFGTSGTSNDSYKLVQFPCSFINKQYRLFTQVHYTSALSQKYMLATILTNDCSNNDKAYIYRRLSYLLPSDEGQKELYSVPLEFFWCAIGEWK